VRPAPMSPPEALSWCWRLSAPMSWLALEASLLIAGRMLLALQ